MRHPLLRKQRYTATERQQQQLQFQISVYAAREQIAQHCGEQRKVKTILGKKLATEPKPVLHQLDSFIDWCFTACEWAETRAQIADLESVLTPWSESSRPAEGLW